MYNQEQVIYNQKEVRDIDREVVPKIFNYLNNDKKKFKLVERKKNKNTEVYYYNHCGTGYYIKHFYFRKWSYRFKEIIGNPIGLTSYRKSINLLAKEIPTALPVAVIIYGGTTLKKDSIFITRELENNHVISKLIRDDRIKNISGNKLEEIVIQLADLWARLLNNNFIHNDPNPKNFLITNLKEDPKVFLIDIADIIELPINIEGIKIHTLARFISDFAICFIKSDVNFNSKYLDLFGKILSEKYNFKMNREKFISILKNLSYKKLETRYKKHKIKSSE